MPDFIVYALADSETHQIRYIGASTKGLLRPMQHAEFTHNPDLAAWVHDLLITRRDYVIVTLATAESILQLYELEKHWIAVGVYFKWPLVNRQHVPNRLKKLDPEQLIPPGKRWNVDAWRRDPEVRARLAASRKSTRGLK